MTPLQIKFNLRPLNQDPAASAMQPPAIPTPAQTAPEKAKSLEAPLKDISNLPASQPKPCKSRKGGVPDLVKDIPPGHQVPSWEKDKASDGGTAETVLLAFMQEDSNWKDYWSGNGGSRKKTMAQAIIHRLADHRCDQYRKEKSVTDKISLLNNSYRTFVQWKSNTGNGLDDEHPDLIAYRNKVCKFYDILLDLIGTDNISHNPSGLFSTGDEEDLVLQTLATSAGDGVHAAITADEDAGSPAWEFPGNEQDQAEYNTLFGATTEAEEAFLESQLENNPPGTPLRPLVPSQALSTSGASTPGVTSVSTPLTLSSAAARVTQRAKASGVLDVLRDSSISKLEFKREVFEMQKVMDQANLELSKKRAWIEEEKLGFETKKLAATRYTAWSASMAQLCGGGMSKQDAIDILGEKPE